MKKIICLVISLLVLLASGSALAESFSLHSGVEFGMSMDEVVSIEETNGFTATVYEKNPNVVRVDCSIAGYDESFLTYAFEDGILTSVKYYFRDSETKDEDEIFSVVKEKLNEKYGSPLAEGSEYIDFESGTTVIDTYNEMNSVLSCELIDFSQWCFQIEGGYVNLMLIDFECMGVKRIDANYNYMTEEYYNSFFNEKAEEQADKEDALNNDL